MRSVDLLDFSDLSQCKRTFRKILCSRLSSFTLFLSTGCISLYVKHLVLLYPLRKRSGTTFNLCSSIFEASKVKFIDVEWHRHELETTLIKQTNLGLKCTYVLARNLQALTLNSSCHGNSVACTYLM